MANPETLSIICTMHELHELLGTTDLQDYWDTAEKMRDGEQDFTSACGDWRYIHKDAIDGIMEDELSGDTYALGCFNADFLGNILGIDSDDVRNIQEADAYNALGLLIMSGGHIKKLTADYISADGYGPHFAHYDHEEHEIGDYCVFQTN